MRSVSTHLPNLASDFIIGDLDASTLCLALDQDLVDQREQDVLLKEREPCHQGR